MLVGKGGWGERRREKLPPSCTLESLNCVLEPKHVKEGFTELD